MPASKADIIARLQKDILPLQGFKPPGRNTAVDTGLGPIRHAFPNNIFPLGAVHEFICTGAEAIAATGGFVAGILSSIMKNNGAVLWISSSRSIFPPALTLFNIDPAQIIFADLQKEKDVLWAIEEALKCEGLAAVVGEISEMDFTASRRLQLAVEQSRVTGFILRHNPRKLHTTACLTRWKITSLQSVTEGDMPGIGFPRWNVELIKVRNGKPGNWEVEWTQQSFRHVNRVAPVVHEEQRKTG